MAVKMAEPIGNQLYGPFLVRFALGTYFVLAGVGKFDNLSAFVAEVQKFNILPDHMATVYALLLPYLEIIAGGLLILGMWTTLGSLVASALLLSFIYAFGVFPSGSNIFNKDVVLLAAALSILYSGAGAFSVDRFRKSG